MTKTPYAPAPESPTGDTSRLLALPEVCERLGRGPQFLTIGPRLYIEVGDPRDFIRKQRNAAKPLLPRPNRKED